MGIARNGRKRGGKGKDTRRRREEGRSRNGIHTWASEHIHGQANTYLGEGIHT